MQKITSYFFLIFFIIGLSNCKSTNHLADASASGVRITNIPIDSAVDALIAPYRNSMDAKMNEVLAQVEVPLLKDRPESTLTNWVADAIHHQAEKSFDVEIAFAYQNFGGIRIPNLSAGNLTVGKIFELMPFDNLLWVIKMKGDEVLKFGQYIAEMDGGPISSSLKIQISNKKLVSMMIKGFPVDESKYYNIAMPDYIANGGDNLTYLIDNERINKNILLRDVLAKEAKEVQTVKSTLDHRIEIIK